MPPPLLSVVVACSALNGVIGYHNKLPWHLKTDLQRFKKITRYHAVIMGKNTYLSIGHPLSDRLNIVISSTLKKEDLTLTAEEDARLVIAPDYDTAYEQACAFAEREGQGEIFLIGGARLYKYAFARALVDKVYLTQVHLEPQGDAFFTETLDEASWICILREEMPAKQGVDEAASTFSMLEKRTDSLK